MPSNPLAEVKTPAESHNKSAVMGSTGLPEQDVVTILVTGFGVRYPNYTRLESW